MSARSWERKKGLPWVPQNPKKNTPKQPWSTHFSENPPQYPAVSTPNRMGMSLGTDLRSTCLRSEGPSELDSLFCRNRLRSPSEARIRSHGQHVIYICVCVYTYIYICKSVCELLLVMSRRRFMLYSPPPPLPDAALHNAEPDTLEVPRAMEVASTARRLPTY